MGLKQRFSIVLIGIMKTLGGLAIFGLICATVSLTTHAQTVTATIATGQVPYRVAVNPVTNKIYVTNYNNNNVTVIDGATNNTTDVAAGTNPIPVAVNPNTNKVYVANVAGNNTSTVTVIDGATNNTTDAAAGGAPSAVAEPGRPTHGAGAGVCRLHADSFGLTIGPMLRFGILLLAVAAAFGQTPTSGRRVHRLLIHNATVVDGNLISARTPADLGPWMKALLAALEAEGR